MFECFEVFPAQSVTTEVDFSLGFIGSLKVGTVVVDEIAVHYQQCVLDKGAHLGKVGVLAVAEMHRVGVFVFACQCNLQDAVANAF